MERTINSLKKEAPFFSTLKDWIKMRTDAFDILSGYIYSCLDQYLSENECYIISLAEEWSLKGVCIIKEIKLTSPSSICQRDCKKVIISP